MRAPYAALLFIIGVLFMPTAQAQNSAKQPQTSAAGLPLTVLEIANKKIVVELAATPQSIRTGLMHRNALATDDGMFFKLQPKGHYCFWMKNTLIPLSLAFISGTRIVAIYDMQPLSLQSHCAPEPVDAALEMNQGWFTKHAIKVGDSISAATIP